MKCFICKLFDVKLKYGGFYMKIKEVVLYATSLDKINSFYAGILELPIIQENNKKISFKAGTSILTFNQWNEYDSPYYHFAFNITESKIEQALQWLKNKRVTINQINGLDDYYSESWNSHSIYFYDSLGNIVEFIARHNILEVGHGDFSSKDIKNISEIGLPVEDVQQASKILQNKYSVGVYKSSNDVFAPLGNEEGLFILSGLNRNWLGSNKKVKVFPLTVDIYNNMERNDNLLGYPYTIRETIFR